MIKSEIPNLKAEQETQYSSLFIGNEDDESYFLTEESRSYFDTEKFADKFT